jgi:hypothetical protein
MMYVAVLESRVEEVEAENLQLKVALAQRVG